MLRQAQHDKSLKVQLPWQVSQDDCKVPCKPLMVRLSNIGCLNGHASTSSG